MATSAAARVSPQATCRGLPRSCTYTRQPPGMNRTVTGWPAWWRASRISSATDGCLRSAGRHEQSGGGSRAADDADLFGERVGAGVGDADDALAQLLPEGMVPVELGQVFGAYPEMLSPGGQPVVVGQPMDRSPAGFGGHRRARRRSSQRRFARPGGSRRSGGTRRRDLDTVHNRGTHRVRRRAHRRGAGHPGRRSGRGRERPPYQRRRRR